MNRAVVLAGGLGSRLSPLTDTVNKHLLPVGDKPMIFWALEYLIQQGFDDLLVVVGAKGCGDLMRLIETNSRLGANVYFAYQRGEGGIADALSLSQSFFKNETIVPVMLGDNIFDNGTDLRHAASALEGTNLAGVFVTTAEHPEEFGVVEFIEPYEDSANIIPCVKRIVEKPEHPASNFVTTGLYLYPPNVFELLKDLEPSARHELEITDLNNLYAGRTLLRAFTVRGTWADAGTPELYHAANQWAWKRDDQMLHS